MIVKLKYPKFWGVKSLLSTFLLPFSWLYFLLSKLRFLLARPKQLSATVICVGNISVGGTGKTQIVKWLAQLLLKEDLQVVII
jgi:tetraacyldisaccharide 4'-kinase